MKKNYPAKFIYFQNKRRELFQRQLMRCSNNFSWILILFRKISSSLSQNIQHSSSKPHDIFLNWLFSSFFFAEVCLAFGGSLSFESDTFLISLETKKKTQRNSSAVGRGRAPFFTPLWLEFGWMASDPRPPNEVVSPPRVTQEESCTPPPTARSIQLTRRDPDTCQHSQVEVWAPQHLEVRGAFWKLLTVSSSISRRVSSVTSRWIAKVFSDWSDIHIMTLHVISNLNWNQLKCETKNTWRMLHCTTVEWCT